MSPSPEFWDSIKGSNLKEVTRWKEWKLKTGFPCEVITSGGIRLLGYLQAEVNGSGRVHIPIVEESRDPDYAQSIVMAEKNQQTLSINLKDPLYYPDIYRKVGLSFSASYTHPDGYIFTSSSSGAGERGDHTAMSFNFHPNTHIIEPLSNNRREIAHGLTLDFEKALPGWQIRPLDKET